MNFKYVFTLSLVITSTLPICALPEDTPEMVPSVALPSSTPTDPVLPVRNSHTTRNAIMLASGAAIGWLLRNGHIALQTAQKARSFDQKVIDAAQKEFENNTPYTIQIDLTTSKGPIIINKQNRPDNKSRVLLAKPTPVDLEKIALKKPASNAVTQLIEKLDISVQTIKQAPKMASSFALCSIIALISKQYRNPALIASLITGICTAFQCAQEYIKKTEEVKKRTLVYTTLCKLIEFTKKAQFPCFFEVRFDFDKNSASVKNEPARILHQDSLLSQQEMTAVAPQPAYQQQKGPQFGGPPQYQMVVRDPAAQLLPAVHQAQVAPDKQ